MIYSLLKPVASRLRIFGFHHIAITNRFMLLTLGCLWVVMVLVVNPRGNFPLNDDWSYALAVRTLLEQGRFHLIDWIAATSVAQILWGALFCLPFGFSFTALRVSSLVLGIIGVLATYGLFRESKAPKLLAFLGATLIATNALYFELSNTFMTDVPFFAIAMLSFLMFVRGLRRDGQFDILAGALLACIAILIRQMGIIIPLAFAIAYLVRKGIAPRNWYSAAYPTVLGLLTLVTYELTVGFSNNYGQVNLPVALHASLGSFLKAVGVHSFIALTYVGLFLLPLLLLGLRQLWTKLSFPAQLLSSLLFVVLSSLLIWQGRSMPFLPEYGNILMKSGLGPAPLRDSFIELQALSDLPEPLWWMITVAGVLGASLLLINLFFALGQIRRFIITRGFANTEGNVTESSFHPSLFVFLSLACSLYFAPIAITGFYDRYLLPLLPLLTCLVLLVTVSIESPIHQTQVITAIFLLLIYALFTLGATHDYFSWNRARWDALHHLTGPEMQVSPRDIDGGYEFNGWYTYHAHYQASPEKSAWWVENDDYAVAFGPLPGYQIIKRFSYEKWLPCEQGSIFILHRTESTP